LKVTAVPKANLSLKDIYDLTFYDELSGPNYRAAQLVLPHVLEIVGRPSSVLDIGCGVGTWLRAIRDYVPDAIVVGVDHPDVPSDLLMISSEEYVAMDLSDGIDLGRTFDLAISLEFLEHVDKRYTETLINSLAKHSNTILFSAAIPGQGGTHHVNENWPAYWIDEFRKKDYICNDIIRPMIWTDEEIPFWYRQNIMLFTKSELTTSKDFVSFEGLSLVHPVLYEKALNRQITEREALSALKASLRRRFKTIRRRKSVRT
jgi:SAM-dependent methyltransferase